MANERTVTYLPNMSAAPIPADASFQDLLHHVISGLLMLVTSDSNQTQGRAADDSGWAIRGFILTLRDNVVSDQDLFWAALFAVASLLGDPQEMVRGGQFDSDAAEALRRLAGWCDANRVVQ